MLLGMMETSAHLGDGKLLATLMHEAANDSSSIDEDNDHERDISTDQKLQSMIENYQQHVLKQKQHYQVNTSAYNAGPPKDHHLKVNGSSIDGPEKIRVSKGNGNHSVVPSTMSHSQPCLYVTEQEQKYEPNGNSYLHYPHSSDPREHHPENSGNTFSNSVDMNALRAENIFLKQKVELLEKNTKVLRSLELAYERIDREFSQMTIHREKQEQLEQTVRFKMEQQLQRLTNENELLQKQIEKLNLMVVQQPVETEHLVHYNRLMTDLLPQNKELLAIKERQQIEIEAQNATLKEQRNHIEMLDKALSNAQERLAAKERSAVDAVALIDKCSHQQKLLQEASDNKQKLQEEHKREKSFLEKEVAQLKMQLENNGTRKNGWSLENEETAKLHKTVQSKDERITQLESSMMELQKRYNEDMQRNEITTRNETEALLTKIRNLEKDKAEKDGRIQDLLDNKQQIHIQWANERRSLDNRVKILEQNLRHNDSQFNGFPSNNNHFYSSHQQTSTTSSDSSQITRPSMPISPRAAVFHDQTMQQMEEMRQKLADRRVAPNNSSTTWMNRVNRMGPQPPVHGRSASGSVLNEYTSVNTAMPIHSPTKIVSLVNPVGHHSSASSADSTTNSSDSISPTAAIHSTNSSNNHSSTTTVNTSSNVHFSLPSSRSPNRMASKMPTSNLSSYIENLPAATRRRFTDQNSVVKKRTAVALGLGSGGYRRSAWNSSSNENSTTSPQPRNYDSLSTDPETNPNDQHPNLTTVVEVNNLTQS